MSIYIPFLKGEQKGSTMSRKDSQKKMKKDKNNQLWNKLATDNCGLLMDQCLHFNLVLMDNI